MESPASTCPRCGAPRLLQIDCPRCGVIYTKAEVRALVREEAPAISETPVYSGWSDGRDEMASELRIRAIAVPLVLGFAWLLVNGGFLRMLTRTFLTMWIHELGHATTAWFCGFAAIPLPWVTMTPESRSIIFPVALAGLLIAWIVRSRMRGERVGVIIGATLLLAQLAGTLLLSVPRARQFIVFGGDGGLFVLGTVLMSTMFVTPGHHLQRSWLRWGFLVIGACAFMDGFKTWLDAHRDFAAIPFGANEGVGLSDASRLVDDYNWGANDLIRRYLVLAGVCFAILLVLYFWSLRAGLIDRGVERVPPE
jgi:hypothetical protein